jgi:hypothetical protein
MALDIYATPAMSDEPERVFSIAGNLLSRRRQLSGEAVEQMLCLRSWQRSGIITLNQGLFEEATEDLYVDTSGDDLTYSNL